MSGVAIPLFLNETYLSHGINKWVLWDMEKAPHGLVVGQSGSGKTYCCKEILAHTYMETNCEVYVLDYKGDTDFDFLTGCKRFYRYTECRNGLHEVYNRFLQRQNGNDKERHPLLLFFDEWSSYCNATDKKQSEEDKKILGILVSLGRSFRVHVIISQQRADAVYFNQFRDSLSMCLETGNLSVRRKPQDALSRLRKFTVTRQTKRNRLRRFQRSKTDTDICTACKKPLSTGKDFAGSSRKITNCLPPVRSSKAADRKK